MRDWLYLLCHMPVNKNGEKWFERDEGNARLAHDRQLISQNHPDLKFALNFSYFKAVLQGTIILREENSGIPTPIEIKIIFPDSYPSAEPVVIDAENQFPHIPDRHFYKNGVCCLWLPLESQWSAEDKNTLLNFIDQVAIFFERQLIYDASGIWAWGERGHGEAGLIEFLEENLGGDLKIVESFLPVLLNQTAIHNKSKCPCQSNRVYGYCHKNKIDFIQSAMMKLRK